MFGCLFRDLWRENRGRRIVKGDFIWQTIMREILVFNYLYQ